MLKDKHGLVSDDVLITSLIPATVGMWNCIVKETGTVLVRTSHQHSMTWISAFMNSGFKVEPSLLIVAKPPNLCFHRNRQSRQLSSCVAYYVVAHKNTSKFYFNPEPSGFIPGNVYPVGCNLITHNPVTTGKSFLKDADGKKVRRQQQDIKELCHLIHHYCTPGGLVYDGSAGTLSIVCACLRMNRMCVAVEIDQTALDLGIARSKKYYKFLDDSKLLIKPGEPRAPVTETEKSNNSWNITIVTKKIQKTNLDDEEVEEVVQQAVMDRDEVLDSKEEEDQEMEKEKEAAEENKPFEDPHLITMQTPPNTKTRKRKKDTKKKKTKEKEKEEGEEDSEATASDEEEDNEPKQKSKRTRANLSKSLSEEEQLFEEVKEGELVIYLKTKQRGDIIRLAYYPPGYEPTTAWLLSDAERCGVGLMNSGIVGAGTGLGTRKALKKGQVFLAYYGNIMYNERAVKKSWSNRIYEISNASDIFEFPLWIDGSPYCPATYINHCSGDLATGGTPVQNVEFIESKEPITVCAYQAVQIRAIDNIEVKDGELVELFTDYGRSYFSSSKERQTSFWLKDDYEGIIDEAKPKNMANEIKNNYANLISEAASVIFTDLGYLISSDFLLKGLVVKKHHFPDGTIKNIQDVMHKALPCISEFKMSPYCNKGECLSQRALFMTKTQRKENYTNLLERNALSIPSESQPTKLAAKDIFEIPEDKLADISQQVAKAGNFPQDDYDWIALEGNWQHDVFPNHFEEPGSALRQPTQGGDGFGLGIATIVLRQPSNAKTVVLLCNKACTRFFKFEVEPGDAYFFKGNVRHLMSHAVVCENYAEMPCRGPACTCKETAVFRYGLHSPLQAHGFWNIWGEGCNKACMTCHGKKSVPK